MTRRGYAKKVPRVRLGSQSQVHELEQPVSRACACAASADPTLRVRGGVSLARVGEHISARTVSGCESKVVVVSEEVELVPLCLVADIEQKQLPRARADAVLAPRLRHEVLHHVRHEVLERERQNRNDHQGGERHRGELVEVGVELALLVEELHARDADVLELVEGRVHGERDVEEADDPEHHEAVDEDELRRSSSDRAQCERRVFFVRAGANGGAGGLGRVRELRPQCKRAWNKTAGAPSPCQ
eukprot:2361910-Pleurochrysis_carterae.AAC.5